MFLRTLELGLFIGIGILIEVWDFRVRILRMIAGGKKKKPKKPKNAPKRISRFSLQFKKSWNWNNKTKKSEN